MKVHARRLLALELASDQGNREIRSKIGKNHVGHDVSEDALIQLAYKQHKIKTGPTAP